VESRNQELSHINIDVPFVPTLQETVERMLEIAGVGPRDFVYDLGCGDGRILVAAVEGFEAKGAVGYEVREELYKEALSRIEGRGLRGRVELFNEDLFKADLSEATVITLYLNHSVNSRLRPKLEREVRPGTRVVSHDFEIKGWYPVRRERCRGDTIYLYVVPEALDMLETLEKKNKNLLRLQSVLHRGYLELREALTRPTR